MSRVGIGSGAGLSWSGSIPGAGTGTPGGNMIAIGDPASASSTPQGFQPVGSSLVGGFSDISQGRLSLIMLDTIIILGIVWYLWTHNVQRGG